MTPTYLDTLRSRLSEKPPTWAREMKATTPKSRKPKKTGGEHATQTAVLQYLALKKIFAWRNNTGAVKTQDGRFFQFGQVGSPDIIAVHGGMVYGLEIKSAIGALSEGQKQWSERFARAGGVYVVVRSLNDVTGLF